MGLKLQEQHGHQQQQHQLRQLEQPQQRLQQRQSACRRAWERALRAAWPAAQRGSEPGAAGGRVPFRDLELCLQKLKAALQATPQECQALHGDAPLDKTTQTYFAPSELVESGRASPEVALTPVMRQHRLIACSDAVDLRASLCNSSL